MDCSFCSKSRRQDYRTRFRSRGCQRNCIKTAYGSHRTISGSTSNSINIYANEGAKLFQVMAGSGSSIARVAAPGRTLAKSWNSTTQPVVSSLAPVAQLTHPMDLANMMAASIEADLKPLREKLKATIIPMQRTIKSLQAEFVADHLAKLA